MKLWMYTVYAVIATVVMTVLFTMFKRNKKDNDDLESFKQGLDETKMKIHQEQATKASKQAFKHIKKAREIAKKPPPTKKESMEEAISAWNDDDI